MTCFNFTLWLFLVYRNTVHFFLLTFCSKLLLNSSSFLVKSLGFSTQMFVSSVNKDDFTSYFHIFYFLIELAWTSYTMWSRHTESRYPSLFWISILAFCLSPLSQCQCRSFVEVLFQDEEIPFNSYFAEISYHELD